MAAQTPELDAYFDRVTEACLAEYENGAEDAVALATRVMALPGFPMHYPTHHYLVPAALLTVARRAQGHPREVIERDLAEALQRARTVPGGACGFQGACGAAVGVGIFFSVLTDASPMSGASWAMANAATGTALLKLAEYGGPRCCKRCSWLSLMSGAKEARRVLGLKIAAEAPVCGFYEHNAECLRDRCPFYPGDIASQHENHSGTASILPGGKGV